MSANEPAHVERLDAACIADCLHPVGPKPCTDEIRIAAGTPIRCRQDHSGQKYPAVKLHAALCVAPLRVLHSHNGPVLGEVENGIGDQTSVVENVMGRYSTNVLSHDTGAADSESAAARTESAARRSESIRALYDSI